MNKFNIFIGEGLDHCPPIQIVSIYVGDVRAFYLGVVGSYAHLLVVCLGVAFGTYKG